MALSLDDRTREIARLVGVQLAVVAAAVHVWWGAPRFVLYVQAGSFVDPRPALFLVSAATVLVGVVALYAGLPERPLYAGGLLVMAAYTVGYVGWHLGGHGGFLPGLTGAVHTESSLAVLVSHLVEPSDALTMAAQLGAIVCFSILLADGGDAA